MLNSKQLSDGPDSWETCRVLFLPNYCLPRPASCNAMTLVCSVRQRLLSVASSFRRCSPEVWRLHPQHSLTLGPHHCLIMFLSFVCLVVYFHFILQLIFPLAHSLSSVTFVMISEPARFLHKPGADAFSPEMSLSLAGCQPHRGNACKFSPL